MIKRFCGFEVDLAQQVIHRGGVRVRLQHKPFQILELLLRQPGVLVTREAMAAHLWPGSRISFERSLNTAVNALRQVLGDSSQDCRFIETRPGLGYCFIATVTDVADQRFDGVIELSRDCLKGRYFLDKVTEQDTRKASGCFEAALLEQECLALAYAGLVDVWCEFAHLSMVPARAAAGKAMKFATLALRHGSDEAAAHIAMGRVRMLFDWDWERARLEFLRALELNARSATAHRYYAALLGALKETRQALEHTHIAQSLEPLSLPIGVDHAWAFHGERQFEAAAEQCWRVLALEPRFWPAQLALGMAYSEMGMQAEAMAELENAVACSGRNPVTLGALGYAGGDVLQELEEQARTRHVNPLSFALAYARLENHSQAAEWMERAHAERDPNLLWMAGRHMGENRAGQGLAHKWNR